MDNQYLYLSHLTDLTTWETNTPASFKVLLDEPLEVQPDTPCEVALVQYVLNTKPLPTTGFYITVCCNLVDLQTFPSNIATDRTLGVRLELPVLKVLTKDTRGPQEIKDRFYLPIIPAKYSYIEINLVPSEDSVNLKTLIQDTLLCIHLRCVKPTPFVLI
jgi:hypothetical protein